MISVANDTAPFLVSLISEHSVINSRWTLHKILQNAWNRNDFQLGHLQVRAVYRHQHPYATEQVKEVSVNRDQPQNWLQASPWTPKTPPTSSLQTRSSAEGWSSGNNSHYGSGLLPKAPRCSFSFPLLHTVIDPTNYASSNCKQNHHFEKIFLT